jgi:hypothetical protein
MTQLEIYISGAVIATIIMAVAVMVHIWRHNRDL